MSEAHGQSLFSSLRMKWVIFSVLLLTYVMFLVIMVAELRRTPLQNIASYQHLESAEAAIIKADLAVFHVVTMLLVDPTVNNPTAIVNYFSLLQEQYLQLQRLFPEKEEIFAQLIESIPAVLARPTSTNLSLVQRQLSMTKFALDDLRSTIRNRREVLVTQIRESSDDLISTTLMLGLMGLLILGTISGLFQFGLTRDIRRLQARVTEIMGGYRGDHLTTRRRDELGQLILGVNQMATTLSQKEQELEIERRRSSYQEKMSAIEDLAGGIAHEFNNPLSCIDGLAHLLREELEEIPQASMAKEYVSGILGYTDHLTTTMRDLQSISIPADKDEYKLIDFNQLLNQTLGMMQFETQKQAIRIDTRLDPMLPAIYGVEEHLALVITNIIENAVDELKQVNSRDRLVTISTHPGDSLICTIEDNGNGIDPQTLNRLFDPFFSTKPVGHGTGLGLPLCRATITEHGGQINITSQEHTGTRVEISLPFAESEPQSVMNG